MSEEKDNKVVATNLRLGDDLIALLRELVQLSLLTGTNIVDHVRAVRAEVVGETVVPTLQYVEQYNAYIEELTKQAETLQEEMRAQTATEE